MATETCKSCSDHELVGFLCVHSDIPPATFMAYDREQLVADVQALELSKWPRCTAANKKRWLAAYHAIPDPKSSTGSEDEQASDSESGSDSGSDSDEPDEKDDSEEEEELGVTMDMSGLPPPLPEVLPRPERVQHGNARRSLDAMLQDAAFVSELFDTNKAKLDFLIQLRNQQRPLVTNPKQRSQPPPQPQPQPQPQQATAHPEWCTCPACGAEKSAPTTKLDRDRSKIKAALFVAASSLLWAANFSSGGPHALSNKCSIEVTNFAALVQALCYYFNVLREQAARLAALLRKQGKPADTARSQEWVNQEFFDYIEYLSLRSETMPFSRLLALDQAARLNWQHNTGRLNHGVHHPNLPKNIKFGQLMPIPRSLEDRIRQVSSPQKSRKRTRSSAPSSSSSSSAAPVCKMWNRGEGSCRFAQSKGGCNFRHVCVLCDSPEHTARQCRD